VPVKLYDAAFVVRPTRPFLKMRASQSLRQITLGFVVSFLAACGGSSNSSDDIGSAVPPNVSVAVAAGVPATAVVTLDGTGSSAPNGATLTYNWVLTTKPAGSTATIQNPTTVTALLFTDLPGTYVVTLTVDDGVRSTMASGSIIAVAFTPPVVLTDIVEPLSGSVQLSISSDPGSVFQSWMVDGTTIGNGIPFTWDTTTVTNGSHVVVARLQFLSSYYVDLTRTVQVNQTTVSFNNATFAEANGLYTGFVGAQSVNGIIRVDATFDGAPLGTLAAPNACLDPTGAACVSAGLNAYAFGSSTTNGAHVIVITATDGIGNSLAIQLRRTVTDAPS
jgi:hypothetical protein